MWPAYIDGRKLEISSGRCLNRSHYCCNDILTFRAGWLLHNLTLDGKLCLRDDKNDAFAVFEPGIEKGETHVSPS